MTELLAPNGKPSNLTPEQYKLVRSKEFISWFGDWEKLALTKINDSGIDEVSLKRLEDGVSKVLDENGEPLVVYHGTKSKFTVFDLSMAGASNSLASVGFWFSPIKSFANNFAKDIWYGDEESTVHEVFLSIKKPKIYNKEEISDIDKVVIISEKSEKLVPLKEEVDYLMNKKWRDNYLDYQVFAYTIQGVIDSSNYDYYANKTSNSKEVIKDGLKYTEIQLEISKIRNEINDLRYSDAFEKFRTDVHKIEGGNSERANTGGLGMALKNGLETILKYKESIINEGYDGIIIEKTRFDKSYVGVLNDQYISLYPEQIKLADGTNITFDGSNPDIRFDDGGEIIINPTEIECHKCHWHWKVKDGGDDLFICHKCNYDNTKFYKFEGLEGEKILGTISYKKGGRTIAQTPAPKKDQIKGSDENKEGSSKDTSSAKQIKFSDETLKKIENKVDAHNKKHTNKKISLDSAKAVVRRGMGAYSSTHRPTISGGNPNSRVAWGLARLNAFLYKIVNGKSKSGKYSQDNDLIEELGYKVQKYYNGGDIQAYEEAMGISEFKEGGEAKPKKVYVSIQFDNKIERDFPDYFWKYDEKTFEELKNGVLKGLVGVSSSPNNIAEWFLHRDCLIVMDYKEFIEINETETIDYYDSYQLMKNNLYLFRRLYANVSRQGEQKDAISQTLKKILEKIVPEINLEMNLSQGQKYSELYRISRFLSPYETSAFPNWIEENKIKIESPIDLTNAILDFNKLNDNWLGQGFENPILTFDELLPIVEKGITKASSVYDSEQEIVLINRELNIPKNSQLFFINKDEVGRIRESNLDELIAKYNLKQLYKLYFVDRQQIQKYRGFWVKKEEEKFKQKLEKGREELEFKKEQVLDELLNYFLEKSISYVKNVLEKEILDYSDSLYYYDETDVDYVEQSLFSIPLVNSIMNTYEFIIKNFWKEFIQKKRVENLDLYAFMRFYSDVESEIKKYFENNYDELEKLNNYNNPRGGGSLDAYRFERLLLKTINDYEKLPELIDYKELSKMYLDKMGRELYRYYDKNDLKLVSQYKYGGKINEEEFIIEELDKDYKEVFQVRGYKNIGGSDFFFSRLNIYPQQNVFTIELPSGTEIGRATLNEKENYLINIRIDENYRRKGLGLNLYNFIEYVTGKKLKPSPIKISKEAQGLWLKRNPDIILNDGGKTEELNLIKNNTMNQNNPKDTITMDVPLLIRFAELMREDIKTDVALHEIVENLLDVKDKGVLTMSDYDSIVGNVVGKEENTNTESVQEEKMEEGGKVNSIKSKNGEIKLSLGEDWYSDDTKVELVPVSELVKFREFDRKVKPKYNQDNSRDNINHLKFMFQKNGVQEPLIIEYSAQDNAVLVVEGNHRINSAIDLGMEYLPARVVLKKYSNFSPSQLKNTIKVSGVMAGKSGYISSDLKPSQVGVEGTMPIYAEGGIIEGRLHSECGDDGCGRKFQVGENGHIIEAERDEAVIVADAFESNEELTIEGTPSEVASALNVIGGGKNFDKGATIIKRGQELEIPELKKEAIDTDVEDVIDSGSIIINRRSMADETEYKVTGTPKQIASAINSVNGNGVVIEHGAEIKEN